MKNVAIIGAGIGGLATALHLRAKGYRVTVFEKNSSPGGKIGEIREKGFRFDTGPSLFTMPQLVDELFELFGKNPKECFRYHELPVVCRYFYPDGTKIDSMSGAEDFAAEATRKLNEPGEHLINYLEKSRELYNMTSDVFIFSPFRSRKTLTGEKARRIAARPGILDAFRSLHQRNKRSFNHPYLVQLFDRYATYNGSNPYSAPATLKIIAHLEHNIGAFFPEKGMYDIVHVLFTLAKEEGVHFLFNTEVREVKRHDNGVKLLLPNNKQFDFNFLVSDMDVYTFYKRILKNSRMPLNIKLSGRSTSALIFYWGVRGTYPGLDIHNILFTANYKKEFRYLFKKKSIYEDPTVYLFISKKHIPGDAPERAENWFVMINTPHNSGQDWDELILKARTYIIQKINKQLGLEIESRILFEHRNDPRSIEQYTGSYGGSLYGAHSNSPFSAFLRHRNRHRKHRNLFFTGGSVHPGGGIPLCLASAKIVSQEFPSL